MKSGLHFLAAFRAWIAPIAISSLLEMMASTFMPETAPFVTDGPFPESKEVVAGFQEVDVESEARAVESRGAFGIAGRDDDVIHRGDRRLRGRGRARALRRQFKKEQPDTACGFG